MNWKGENFYTGNHLPAFVSSGRPFREWVAKERRRGQRTFYFLCLPERADTLAAELGLPARWQKQDTVGPVGLDLLTTPADNTRFALVRARFSRAPLASPGAAAREDEE
jgi:hypothetical protein